MTKSPAVGSGEKAGTKQSGKAHGNAAFNAQPSRRRSLRPSSAEPLPRTEAVSKMWDYIKRSTSFRMRRTDARSSQMTSSADLWQGAGDHVRDERLLARHLSKSR